MAASRQSDVDMFGYWEAHRKSGSHSTYWWRDMLRALRPPVPRRDSILQDLLRACPSVKERCALRRDILAERRSRCRLTWSGSH
jgi:hypothetical protein